MSSTVITLSSLFACNSQTQAGIWQLMIVITIHQLSVKRMGQRNGFTNARRKNIDESSAKASEFDTSESA